MTSQYEHTKNRPVFVFKGKEEAIAAIKVLDWLIDCARQDYETCDPESDIEKLIFLNRYKWVEEYKSAVEAEMMLIDIRKSIHTRS
jgi:hypothetical protein